MIMLPLGRKRSRWEKRLKNKTKIRELCVSLVLMGVMGGMVFGWGSMVGSAHHQYILTQAYKLLMQDPVVIALNNAGQFHFPSLDQIQTYEGVHIIGRGGKPWFGKSGPGPDSEEHSFWSWHYYNPRTGEGNGPSQAAKYYERLREKLLHPDWEIPVDFVERGKPHLYPKDTTGARDAAYLAHFIADMSVPYHVNGMWGREAARLYQAGQTFLHEKVVGPTGKGPEDWARELERWYEYFTAKPVADWFDPWYFNYLGIPLASTITHSHIMWEGNYGLVRSHIELAGFAPEYLILQRHNGRSNVTNIAGFAIEIARYTSFREKDWWIIVDADPWGKQAQEGLGHSVRNVYTAWRACFSALQPEFEVVHDPLRDRRDLIIKINNRTWNESPTQIRVRAKIQGGELHGLQWPNWHTLEESSYDDYWSDRVIGDVWRIASSDPGAVITVEVEGCYAKMPDSGRALVKKSIAPTAPNPAPLGAVEFQEKDIQGIDPMLTAGQVSRRTDEWFHPISELKIDSWTRLDRQDGLLIDSYKIEQYIEKERAEAVFKNYLERFNKMPKSYKQAGVEFYHDTLAVRVNPEKTECSVQYRTRSPRSTGSVTTWYQESISIHKEKFIIFNLLSIEKEQDQTAVLDAWWERIRVNSRSLIDRRSGGK